MVRENALARANSEFINRYAVKLLPQLQFRRGKFGMVGRVGKVLSLQTESVARLIHSAFFPGDRTIKKISRVELNARLGRQHFQSPAAGGLVRFGRFR